MHLQRTNRPLSNIIVSSLRKTWDRVISNEFLNHSRPSPMLLRRKDNLFPEYITQSEIVTKGKAMSGFTSFAFTFYSNLNFKKKNAFFSELFYKRTKLYRKFLTQTGRQWYIYLGHKTKCLNGFIGLIHTEALQAFTDFLKRGLGKGVRKNFCNVVF